MGVHLNVGENALMFGFPATGLAISLFHLQNGSKRSQKNYCYSHYSQFTSTKMSHTWFQDLPRVQEETHMQIWEAKFGLFPLCLPSTQNHKNWPTSLFSSQGLFCTNGPNACHAEAAQAFRTECPSSFHPPTELGSFEVLFPPVCLRPQAQHHGGA